MADDNKTRALSFVVAGVGLFFVSVLIASTPVSNRLGITPEIISVGALLVVLAVVYLFATGQV